MNILFLGDLVGERSFKFVTLNIKSIIEKYNITLVVVNGENISNGYGLKPQHCEGLFEAGVDVITSGNHIWDQVSIIPYIARNSNLIRPYNYKDHNPGSGYGIFEDKNGKKILVANFICNVFMRSSDSPFAAASKLLDKYKLNENCDGILIDIHGETSSEKQAFANMLDGRVSAVLGSHTHVPTSDLRILPNGTAFITDAGMCGDYDSVIGGEKISWIGKFLTKENNVKINSSSKNSTLCGIIIRISQKTGLSDVARQIILGDVLENKIPSNKYFV